MNLTDKTTTLALLGNLGSMDTNTMLSTVETAHRMILSRKGKQKASGGGISAKQAQENLYNALAQEADKLPPVVRTAWESIMNREEQAVGLEYHYLETTRDAIKAVLAGRGVTVSLKGDGTMSVKRTA
jgi:hypothetical protein